MDTASDAGCMTRRMRPSTLDLRGTPAADPASEAVLSSPDVRLLKLATPELERLVLQQYTHLQHHHQQQSSSKDRQLTLDVVQAANEGDARGFVDVLLEVHGQRQMDCDPGVSRSTSHANSSAASVRRSTVTEAPRHVDFCRASARPVSFDTPPMSPRRANDDQRARLERKRARNRLAASRCRNRKLERIEQLQSQADRLRAANARLADEVRQLRETVRQLRREVLQHVDCQLDVSVPSPFNN